MSVLALLCAAPLRGQPQLLVTSDEIDQAIQAGLRGDVEPYRLKYARSNPLDVGLVFTPFVRVALAAQVAGRAGHALTPDRIPKDLLEPVVWIAFRWYCCDEAHGNSRETIDPFTPPFDYRIAMPGDAILRATAL